MPESSDSSSAFDARPAVWIILSAFCFAVMGSFTHALGTRCDWLTIALVRAVFMFISAVAISRAAGSALVVWRPRTLWVRSLAGSFSLVCSFYALSRLPVGDVVTLTSTYPLWILVLSWIGTRRDIGPSDVIGVACGVVGVALIGQPHFAGETLAAAVALLSAVSTAVAMIGLHRLRGIDARAVVAHFAGVASVVAGCWYALGKGSDLVSSERITLPPFLAPTVLLLLGVGLSGTVGQWFLTKAYGAGAPTRVSVLALTQVVFAVAFDVILWRRELPPASLLGSVLILAPTAWVMARGGGLAATSAAGPVDT